MTTVDELIDDLAAEHDALDAVVAPLSAAEWSSATPSPGWTVADQIGHLWYFDGTAAQALDDPDAFASGMTDILGTIAEGTSMDDVTLGDARRSTPADLLEAWRRGRHDLIAAARNADPDARVPWYGPDMSLKSFLTARLMETWAHGQDVVDAVSGSRPATDRLRHIAQLGFITRGWTYVNRGEPVPAVPVRVVLAAPSGAQWSHGPEDAPDRIEGTARDFCLVVTQRRNIADTGLLVSGDAAADWMSKAQAFAGGVTDPPAASRGTRR